MPRSVIAMRPVTIVRWLLAAAGSVALLFVASEAFGSGPPQLRGGTGTNLTSGYTLLDGVRSFRYYSYGEVVAFLSDLERRFPQLVELTTAQDAYGLQSPGTCLSVTGASVPCESIILRLTNEATLPEPERPEVFFSGALHGNEWVGPITTVEMAIALVEHYESSEWARRMLNTRAIYIMPFPNSIGYEKKTRAENNIDPNRDFPYNQRRCLKTVTSRALYELWSRHVFQLAITFHGGMQAIAYEWGSMNYKKNTESPDDAAQVRLAHTMSKFAGKFHGDVYPAERMTKLVYPVDGGMEDWGYAASWDTDYVFDCDAGTKYGGYSVARQRERHNNASFRVLNVLVETSDHKIPDKNDLGTSAHMLEQEGGGDGHVPRNMRLMAVMIDVVQPYLTTHPHGVVERHSARLPFFARWAVRGCFGSDSAALLWGRWPSAEERKAAAAAGFQPPSLADVEAAGGDATASWTPQAARLLAGSGGAWWAPFVLGSTGAKQIGEVKGWPPTSDEPPEALQAQQSAAARSADGGAAALDGDYDLFRANFSRGDEYAAIIQRFPEEGEYFVVAVATGDRFMLHQKAPAPPGTPPQSNFVNARLNPDYYVRAVDEVAGEDHVIRGRGVWHAKPIHVKVVAEEGRHD